MNSFPPPSDFIHLPPWYASGLEYLVDRTQRTILFWDVLRKRGDNYLAHLKAGQPPVLVFDYEMVLDGRTFERPVNYSLIRILDRRSGKAGLGKRTERRLTQKAKLADGAQPVRPIVIIDPRAGHGPGIGGSKLNSQIGVALDYGHPVYFVTFYIDPATRLAPSNRPLPRSQKSEVSQVPPYSPPRYRIGLAPSTPPQYDKGDPLKITGPVTSGRSAAISAVAQPA